MVVTAQPSAEYRSHHDVAAPRVDRRAFRQGWLVQTRLAQLYDDGAIDTATFDAAVAVRTDWETAFGRGRSAPIMALPGGGACDREHDRQIARADAVGRLRRVALRLGAFDASLVDLCVIADLSWPEIGRRIGVSHPTARRYTLKALRRLAGETATRRGAGSPLERRGGTPDGA